MSTEEKKNTTANSNKGEIIMSAEEKNTNTTEINDSNEDKEKKLLEEYDGYIDDFLSRLDSYGGVSKFTHGEVWATVEYETELTDDDEVDLIVDEIKNRTEDEFYDRPYDEAERDFSDYADVVWGDDKIIIVKNAEDSNHEKGFYTYDEAYALIDAFGKENANPVILSPFEVDLIVRQFPVYGKDYIEGEDDDED